MTDSELASGVFTRKYDRLDRAVQLGLASGRLIKVEFPPDAPEDAERNHELLDRIGTYLAGEKDDFGDVDLAITVPTEQREVLEATREVPYGEEASVSQVTRMATLDPDDADDLALVKNALRENPVPLVIPDHRVQGGPYATPGDVREVFRSAEEI